MTDAPTPLMFKPALSKSREDAVRFEQPGGLTLTFLDPAGKPISGEDFERTGLTLAAFAHAAGVRAIDELRWQRLGEAVYGSDDGSWAALLCAPSALLVPQDLPGRPVLYVVNESLALLTGDGSAQGLAHVRHAMRAGLARVPLTLHHDNAKWLPFDARLSIGVRGAHAGSSTTFVYLDEIREQFGYDGAQRIELMRTVPPPAATQPLQAMIEKQGRHAGLLGARFFPDPRADDIRVSVTVRAPDTQQIGLPHDFAQAVMKGVERIARGLTLRELGAGRLDFAWARVDPVDSCDVGFQDLAEKLVPLLSLSWQTTAEEVSQAWQRQEDSVQVGQLLDWLDGCMIEHPERLTACGPGASAHAIAALETELGTPLPPIVRWIAARHASPGATGPPPHPNAHSPRRHAPDRVSTQ